MKSIFLYLNKLKFLAGRKVIWLMATSIAVGIGLFLVETSFVFVLQLFLHSLQLLPKEQLMLPNWLPVDFNFTIFVLFAFGILRGAMQMLKSYLSGMVGQEFIKLQRSRLAEYSFNFAHEISINQVITILTERVSQGGSFLQNLSQVVLISTSSCLFFISGLKIAPIEMMLGVFTLGIFLFPMRYLNKRINIAGIGVRDEWNIVSSTLITGLKNYFFLKVYNLIDRETQKSLKALSTYRDHYQKYYQIAAARTFFPSLAGILVVCLITFVSVKYIHTKGVLLVSFFYIFIRFSQGLSEISASFSELTLHRMNFLELYKWSELHLKVSTQNKNNFLRLGDDSGNVRSISIEARELYFSYSGDDFLFQDTNFKITKGDLLLIKGPSGVGKSTLLQLILGMIKPNRGTVLINSIDLDKHNILFSDFVGYVGPEPYLIVGTLRDNLIFGLESKHFSDADLKEAMKFACLDPNQFPLDLEILEHVALSTGQKQRLAIARAILRKPQLLILDEATANLDPTTERKILDNLQALMKDITTIVISHKSTFDKLATVEIFLQRSKETYA